MQIGGLQNVGHTLAKCWFRCLRLCWCDPVPSRVLVTCGRACPSQPSGRLPTARAPSSSSSWRRRTSTPPSRTAQTARTTRSMTATTTTQRPTTTTTTALRVRTGTRQASRTTSCWTDPSTSRSRPRCFLVRLGPSLP